MFALAPVFESLAVIRDDESDSTPTSTHPLAQFSNAECRAWVAMLIALRAHPRRRGAFSSSPVGAASAAISTFRRGGKDRG